jgi:predicted extracellular nuclease
MRRASAVLTIAALLAQTTLATATPFINEIHYDNSGTDVNEFIELAGGVGWDLTGWRLVLYNGNPGQRNVYDTRNLSGTFANDTGNGWGFQTFYYPTNGIQNGGGTTIATAEPDGIALVDSNNNVVQFLSYEGTFTAAGARTTANPAGGITSTNISGVTNGVPSGAFEDGTQPRNWSIRLSGTQTAGTSGNVGSGGLGSQPNGFTWQSPTQGTPFVGATDGTGTYSVGTSGDYLMPNAAGTVKGAINQGQSFTQAPPAPPPTAGVTDLSIAQIQGASHTSPYVGQSVRTTGIVTQIASNGYWVQSQTSANIAGASDGIFVFTGTAGAKPAVGDLVRVQGSIQEFNPAGASNTTRLTVTQFASGSTTTVLSGNNALPAAIVIGPGGRQPPQSAIETSPSSPGNFGTYDPVNAGRDFWESLEGMRVQINNPSVIAPSRTFSSNYETYVRVNQPGYETSVNSRGGLTIAADSNPNNVYGVDYNPTRILVNPQVTQASGNQRLANVGDTLSPVTGVATYDFGNYRIIPDSNPTLTAGGLAKQVAAITGTSTRFTYADYNLENLENNQGARYTQLGLDIVNRLRTPDVLGLQELVVRNDAGQAQDVAATLQSVVDAIVAAGGPRYAFAFLPPAGSTDTRIVSAYLYNPDRVGLVAGSLAYVPGTTDASSAYNNSRAPLVAQFTFNGARFTAINNHWTSRGGSQDLYGTNEPAAFGGESRRLGQGQELNAYIRALLASNPNARIIVNGDLNSFYFESPQVALRGTGASQVLYGLYELLALNERYSYSFDGNSQQLDYIYASSSLYGLSPQYQIVHYNSEFQDQFSDHDPSIASFYLVPAPSALALLGLGVAGLVARRRRAR